MNSIALLFIVASTSFNLPPGLLSALCYVESTHHIHAVSPHDGTADSLGVCQIQHPTAATLGFVGTKKQLLSPKVNTMWAAKYLRYQLDRYGGDIVMAVSSYNVGQWRTRQDGTPVNLPYVRKVMRAWAEHR